MNNILIYFTYFRILSQQLNYSLNPEILPIDKIVMHITRQYSMLSTSNLVSQTNVYVIKILNSQIAMQCVSIVFYIQCMHVLPLIRVLLEFTTLLMIT